MQVSEEQIHADLSLGKFEWDHPRKQAAAASKIQESTKVFSDAYSACKVHLVPPPSSKPGTSVLHRNMSKWNASCVSTSAHAANRV